MKRKGEQNRISFYTCLPMEAGQFVYPYNTPSLPLIVRIFRSRFAHKQSVPITDTYQHHRFGY